MLEFFPVEGEDVVLLHKVYRELASMQYAPPSLPSPLSSNGINFNDLANFYQPKLTVAVNSVNQVLDRFENDLLHSIHEKHVHLLPLISLDLCARDICNCGAAICRASQPAGTPPSRASDPDPPRDVSRPPHIQGAGGECQPDQNEPPPRLLREGGALLRANP